MTARFLGSGWGFPVRRQKEPDQQGCFAVAAYEESVRQAIEIILTTAKGERVMRPDFGCGLQDLVFALNNSATRGMAESEVEEALRRWEPRIELEKVRAEAGGDQGELLLIDIHYRVRVTDNRFNLVYPFYLQRRTP